MASASDVSVPVKDEQAASKFAFFPWFWSVCSYFSKSLVESPIAKPVILQSISKAEELVSGAFEPVVGAAVADAVADAAGKLVKETLENALELREAAVLELATVATPVVEAAVAAVADAVAAVAEKPVAPEEPLEDDLALSPTPSSE